MRIHKLLVLAVSSTMLLTTIATSAASATGYDSNDGPVDISNTAPAPGSAVRVGAGGFKALSSVTITLHSEPVVLASTAADGTGYVDATVTIPADTPAGAHEIQLTGIDPSGAALTLTGSITVTGGASGSLAHTGAAILTLGLLGVTLLGTGALLSRARRRALPTR